jgi:hypothetical protein
MPQQINGSQVLSGTPTDGSYPSINVPGISATDKLPDAIDKLIGIIDKLAPAKSPNLSTKSLSYQGTLYTARHVRDTLSVPGNIVWTSLGGSTSTASAGSSYSTIVTTQRPIANVSDSSSINQTMATFSDGQSGTLYSIIDSNYGGYRVLEGGYWTGPGSPDVGLWNSSGASASNGNLYIAMDQDPYTVAPNVGFWTSLKATMSSTQSYTMDGVEHYYDMYHTTTAFVGTKFRFIYASASAASAPSSYTTSGFVGSALYVTASSPSPRYSSGVPSLAVGDIITGSYSVINNGQLISRFYNSNQITNFIVTAGTTVNQADMVSGVPLTVLGGSGAIPFANQGTWSVAGITVSVASGMYATNSTLSVGLYSALNSTAATVSFGGISANGQSGKYLYIDTVGSEINPSGVIYRVYSGTNSYPSFTSSSTYSQFFGPTYTTTQQQVSLSTTGNEELMYQNGVYQYPSGNWTNNYPTVGPDYTSVPVGSFGYRWVTFNVGSITSASSFTLGITGSGITNTGLASPITGSASGSSSFKMFVTIVTSGGTQSVGWLDANAIWSSGTILNNGDPCVASGASSLPYTRSITLGTPVYTGTVYVRVGIPSGSSINIKYITKS